MMIIERGDKKTLYHRALNDNGGVIDLSGADIEYLLLEKSTDTSFVLKKSADNVAEIKIVSSLKGLFNVYLTNDDTQDLDKNVYAVKIIINGSDTINDIIKVRPYK